MWLSEYFLQKCQADRIRENFKQTYLLVTSLISNIKSLKVLWLFIGVCNIAINRYTDNFHHILLKNMLHFLHINPHGIQIYSTMIPFHQLFFYTDRSSWISFSDKRADSNYHYFSAAEISKWWKRSPNDKAPQKNNSKLHLPEKKAVAQEKAVSQSTEIQRCRAPNI